MPGTTIKVAGTCAGVQMQEGVSQTLLITNQVTIVGGYTITTWLSEAQPSLYATTLDAEGAGRVIRVTSNGRLTASGLHLTNGNITGLDGAGLYNEGHVSLTDSIIRGNVTDDSGGGIFNNGTLTLSHSTILTNTASGSGGGIDNRNHLIVNSSVISGNLVTSSGGGIYNNGGANITVISTTIGYNHSNSVGGGLTNRGEATVLTSSLVGNVSGLEGGGIYNFGTFTLTNSTVSSNRSNDDSLFDLGGGVFIPVGGGGGIRNFTDMVIQYSSIISNSAPFLTQTAGIAYDSMGEASGAFVITASVVAYNDEQNCYYSSAGPVASDNVSSDNSCGVGFTQNDPLLGPLTDNGNDTPYHHPLNGSPLVDALSIGVADCNVGISEDQRGVGRPQDNACDIGAIEVVQTDLTPTLSITVTNSTTAGLSWPNEAKCDTDIYRSDAPYVGFALLVNNLTSDSYEDSYSVGDVATNAYYYVETTCWGDTLSSNSVGEFDYALTAGD